MTRPRNTGKLIDLKNTGDWVSGSEIESLFEFEHGETFARALVIDEGRLIFVAVTIDHLSVGISNHASRTDFFELASGRKIPREERYATEHGKTSHSDVSEGISESSIVRVDTASGAETVDITVIINGEEVFSDTGVDRWSNPSPYKRYLAKLARDERNRNAVRLLSEQYLSASRAEKVMVMLRYFNKCYGDAFEWGIENPELFTDTEVLANIRHDPDLKPVIWDMLNHAEERSAIYGDGNKKAFFKKIVRHYKL